MGQLDRITQQPGVMGGKACIRGLRVTVGMIVGQIGAGHSIDDLLADYPYLEREDILQALRFAAWRLEDGEKPSVIQFRAEDVSPEAMGPQLIVALHQLAIELEEGALVTVDPNRARLRILPLRLT